METVTQMSEGQCMMVNTLPIIFLGITILLIVLAIRYFIRLGKDVQAIRKILEEKQYTPSTPPSISSQPSSERQGGEDKATTRVEGDK